MLPPVRRAVALALLALVLAPASVVAQDVPEPEGPPSPLAECPEGYPFNPPECRPDLIVIGASHGSTDVRHSPNARLCASFVNIGRTTVAVPFRFSVYVDGHLAGDTIVQVKQPPQEEPPNPAEDPADAAGAPEPPPPPPDPTDVPGYQTGQGDGPYCFGVTLTPGTHPYFFRVDTNDEVDETNESNNQMRTAYVKIGDYPTVDLSVTGVGVSPRDPRPNENQLLIARVRNTGQTPTNNTTVVFEDDNGVIGTARVPPLYPRQVTDVVVVTRPELRPPGNFTLIATIDPENDLKEINESNNARATPYFVAEHPAPDLHIQNVSYYGNFTARRGIYLNVTYANKGDRGILAPSIRVYDDGNVSLGNHTARVLNVQQTARGQFRLVLSAGYHPLRIVVDPDNLVGERNEKNNVHYLNLTVFPGLTEFPTPNLVVERLTVAPDDPRPGEPVRISALVRNIGDLGSNKTDAEFRVNGRSIGNVTIPAVPMEASVVVAMNWDGGGEGVYDFTVTSDPRNKIAEIDEGDNELGLSFIIQTTAPPPPPPPPTESKDPITPPTEEPPVNEDIVEAPQEPRLLPGQLLIGHKTVPGGLRAIIVVGLRNPTLEAIPTAFVTFKVDGQVLKEVLLTNVRAAAITNATTGEIDIPPGRHNVTAEVRVAGSTERGVVSRVYELEAGPEEKKAGIPAPGGLALLAAVGVALLARAVRGGRFR